MVRRQALRTGTPRLLRAINDQAALELLLEYGPLTRTQLGEHTGLSKPTVSQLVERLEERGLVAPVGQQGGGRGPNAMLYSVVASAAYVVGLDVAATTTTAAVADLSGAVVGQAEVDTDGESDPVALVRGAILDALAATGISLDQVHEVIVGTPGLIDPRTGDIGFAWELPAWHGGLLSTLRERLGLPVRLENDVNLAAVAEQHFGRAVDADDFALLWIDRGVGMALVLDGQLHRGVSGGAGEIGYLPVPGAPVTRRVSHRAKGAFQQLVGADAVRALGREHGFRRGTAAETIRAAQGGDEQGALFLDELAARLAIGVAAICAVVDPGLVVLSGDVGRAGGEVLAEKVQAEVAVISPLRPAVAVSSVEGKPSLRGALLSALRTTREAVFADTAPRVEAPGVG